MKSQLGSRPWLGSLVAMACSYGVSQAQPWDAFTDSLTGAQCDVINADNAELVVLGATGQLVIVTGQDVTLVDSFVDLDGNVTFEGAPAGFVSFVDDGDGFRTLWWTGLTGQVVALDPFTSVPFVSDFFPEEFFDVPCDACPLWDDPLACSLGCVFNDECDDENSCTLDSCIAGDCVYLDRVGSCDDGFFCTSLDSCVDGICVGIGNTCPFRDCDEVDNVCFDPATTPPVVLNLCGSSMALTMALSLMGLASFRASKRVLRPTVEG
jgi:hypothetical protein